MKNGSRKAPRWPLLVIAAPAAVAIWSGWVGLGGLCGFGPVRLLPGISDLTVNTAITLPIGVEAYAAFAIGAWMSPATPPRARTFARWSALGALAYGMAGQVIYHLLAAARATVAPWPVVVVVSCMPVAVVAFAAALMHLLNEEEEENRGRADHPDYLPPGRPASVPASLPTWREIQERRGCSPTTAKKVRAELRLFRASMVPPAGDTPPVPAGAHPNGTGGGKR